MKKTLSLLSLLLLTAGCFEIDNTINLQRDLSGTADFHLGVDMEPMIVIMAQVAKEMEGKKGALTPDEIAKAKADFKKKAQTTKSGDDFKPSDIQKELPEGVKLLDYKVQEREFGMATDFKFAFDRLSRLVGVKLPSKQSADPTQKSVIDTPFEGLELIEKGDMLTIRTKPQNPAATVEKEKADAPPMDPGTEKLIRDAFSKMRVTYRITAPFRIVSHNAMRREGDTLIWEYNLERFEAMAKSKKTDDLGVQVTYQR